MQVKDLLNYLKQENERGLSHVYLDQPARDHLRSLIKSSPRKLTSLATPAKEVQEIREAFHPKRVTPAKVAEKPSLSQKEEIIPVSVSQISALQLPSGTKEEKLNYLRTTAEQWGPAIDLNSLRPRAIFSTGSLDSKIIFIAEAPGYEEELKRKPFIGRAGRKLDQILKAMGLSREEVYLSHLCKFRPAFSGQTTNNRQPTQDEMEACLPLLKEEIKLLQPECIVILGHTAAKGFLKVEQTISELREQWFEYEGIPVRISHHPTHLLKNEDNPKEKRKVWEDMLAVMEKLSLPISEKQRGFFKGAN